MRIKRSQSVADIAALSHVRINAASDSFGWRGLRLEIAVNQGCDVTDVMVDGHYVVCNLAETALYFETLIATDWVPGCLPPQTFWIIPEGRPFAIRHGTECYWAGAMIDGDFLDSVAGAHHELKYAVGATDAVLSALMRALVARLYDHDSPDGDLDRELIRVFVLTLGKRHGIKAADSLAKGGIAPTHLRALMSWLDESLGLPLTIDAMATRVGLSSAHFSREFKRSVGVTPWGYVVQRRLESARKLLAEGESIGTTAKRCGFADASHLSRLFRQRFGVPPLVFVHAGAARDTSAENNPQ